MCDKRRTGKTSFLSIDAHPTRRRHKEDSSQTCTANMLRVCVTSTVASVVWEPSKLPNRSQQYNSCTICVRLAFHDKCVPHLSLVLLALPLLRLRMFVWAGGECDGNQEIRGLVPVLRRSRQHVELHRPPSNSGDHGVNPSIMQAKHRCLIKTSLQSLLYPLPREGDQASEKVVNISTYPPLHGAPFEHCVHHPGLAN